MATKLKGLNVKKVDFVDEGANPDAHIVLYKRRDGKPDEPPEQESGNKDSIWKRLFAPLAKLTGVTSDELDGAFEAIEKSGALSFNEQMNNRKMSKIADEMWDICFALQNSLVSIMRDDELDQAAASTAMQESLDDFEKVVKDAISTWSSGKTANITKTKIEVTEDDLVAMKSARDRLDAEIQKASVNPGENQEAKKDEIPEEEEKESKGDDEEMKIDKNKLTPAEKAFLEDIEKRYGADDGQAAVPVQNPAPTATEATEEIVAKALQKLGIAVPTQQTQAPAAGEDIYKGMSAEAMQELETLRKFRQDAEDKELHEVAKRYEILGRKDEELFPILKSLKASSQDAYDMMVKALDASKETVEKSGAFGEIGKTGHGASAPEGTGAWAQAEQKAAEIMKSKNITKNQALDEVFVADPVLARKCEEEG